MRAALYCRVSTDKQELLNQDKGDIYRKYLRVARAGGVSALKVLRVGLPALRLRRVYEAKKSEFTTKLNQSIEADLVKLEDGDKPKKELTAKQEEVLKCLLEGMNVKQISEHLIMSEENVYAHMRWIKKKGVHMKAVKNKNGAVERFTVTDFGDIGSV